MQQETAETIALQALGWLATQDDLLPVFLGATGASEQDVRARATEPEFLGAVLDFLKEKTEVEKKTRERNKGVAKVK